MVRRHTRFTCKAPQDVLLQRFAEVVAHLKGSSRTAGSRCVPTLPSSMTKLPGGPAGDGLLAAGCAAGHAAAAQRLSCALGTWHMHAGGSQPCGALSWRGDTDRRTTELVVCRIKVKLQGAKGPLSCTAEVLPVVAGVNMVEFQRTGGDHADFYKLYHLLCKSVNVQTPGQEAATPGVPAPAAVQQPSLSRPVRT